MSTTPILTLGPYRQGGIPPPLVLTFENSAGVPTPLPTPYVARLEYRARGGSIVERIPTVDPDQVTYPGRVTYAWVAADFAAAGDFAGEIWVGNGTNRYPSIRLEWFTQPAVAVPVI